MSQFTQFSGQIIFAQSLLVKNIWLFVCLPHIIHVAYLNYLKLKKRLFIWLTYRIKLSKA